MPAMPKEYYRNYRATRNGMQEKKEQQMFRQGILACIAIARETIAGKALTGYQFARLLENAVMESETQEKVARQAFIAALRPREG